MKTDPHITPSPQNEWFPWLLLFPLTTLLAVFTCDASNLFLMAYIPSETQLLGFCFFIFNFIHLVGVLTSKRRDRQIAIGATMLSGAWLILIACRHIKMDFEMGSTQNILVVFFGALGSLNLLVGISAHLHALPKLQIGLRQLLFSTTTIAVFLALAGWAVRFDQMGQYESQLPIATHVESLGGSVTWQDWKIVGVHLRSQRIVDSDLQPLASLSSLSSIDLSRTAITDAALQNFSKNVGLGSLDASETLITDAGLEQIAKYHNLTYLQIDDNEISDQGIAYLSNLTQLQHLYISNTPITDNALQHLEGLRDLSYLHLPATAVTIDGMRTLKQQLPKCRIYGTPNFKPLSLD